MKAEVLRPMTLDPDTQWLLRGPRCLDDATLLSFLLTRGGAPGPSTLRLASLVLERGGGLLGLPRAREGELCEVPGIGPSRARRLLALVELARRLDERPVLRGEPCADPDSIYRLVRGQLRDRRQESLWVLLLDSRGRRLDLVEVARGGRNAVTVTPAEVFEPALREGAAQLVLIHNHPSGDPEPSPQDQVLTERLQSAGELLGVTVADHIVVGGASYSSLAERGLLRWPPTGFDPAPTGLEARDLECSDGAACPAMPQPTNAEAEPSADVKLQNEATPWVLPEQLPLRFLWQLGLPFGGPALGGGAPTQEDTRSGEPSD